MTSSFVPPVAAVSALLNRGQAEELAGGSYTYAEIALCRCGEIAGPVGWCRECLAECLGEDEGRDDGPE